uniref:TAFA chemokine like family member 5 n=1 Tax=Cyprinus carpio carpio TaxID=630221 RepID=A0A9J8AKV2_CYPCA
MKSGANVLVVVGQLNGDVVWMLKAVRMLMLRVAWALAGAAICCFLIILIHSRFLREGQLAAGTCEIVTLDRDSSQPRRTIARQTARCACKKGQIAGTTRARPACVDATRSSLYTDQRVTAVTQIQYVSSPDGGSAPRKDLYSPERQLRPGQLDKPQRQIPCKDLVSDDHQDKTTGNR